MPTREAIMAMKFLVTVSTPAQTTAIQGSGCDILAEYPNTMLVRCENAEADALRAQGLELAESPTPPLHLAGRSFAMADAVAAGAAPTDPTRPAYYIAQLVGPAKGEWLEALKSDGAEVIGALPTNALVLRMLPSRADAVRQRSWVEGVTIYHSVLKISPRLRLTGRGPIGPSEFAAPLAVGNGDATLSVEVTAFPGESIDPIVDAIRAASDTIISSSRTSVKALVKQSTIGRLANQVSVQAVQPFAFPTFDNDVARAILEVPLDNTFPAGNLDGQGQIVGVCDSGLDTGDPATVHQDLRGRVDAVVSWPTQFDASVAQYINGPFNSDDGPEDTNSGHGTHVAGSVAGNGAAADAVGSATVPMGLAPAARIFFQAIEQQVNWKPVSQLIAEGIPVPFIPGGWPPGSVGLYGLPDDLGQIFAQAYNAGVRIHTNSWGARDDGIYNANSRAVDQSMSAFRDLLIIFSAGNDAQDDNSDSQIDLDSIGSPGTAKNCVTVGASENDRPNGSAPTPGANINWTQFQFPRFAQMAAAGHVSDNPAGVACFSSRGPVDDGRTKPEVVAPGTNVMSLRSSLVGADPLWGDVTPATDPLNGLYCWSGGTSMATPLVAGLAALVRQHLIEQRGHFQNGVKPSGALIKAFILNGAVRVGGQFSGEVPTGVNNVTGFGRANAVHAFSEDGLEIAFDDEPDNAVETGEMRTYSITAASAAHPLRITLCWTDPPSPGAGQLQNTLYLQLVTPDGAVLDGDLTPFPTVTNNAQQIEIATPIAGAYTIRVRGVSVTQQAPGAAPGANPRQDFALVMSNGIGLNVPQP